MKLTHEKCNFIEGLLSLVGGATAWNAYDKIIMQGDEFKQKVTLLDRSRVPIFSMILFVIIILYIPFGKGFTAPFLETWWADIKT